MLDSAQEAAENTLLDQRLFLLDDSDYQRFVARLDAPVEPSDALEKLLAKPVVRAMNATSAPNATPILVRRQPNRGLAAIICHAMNAGP